MSGDREILGELFSMAPQWPLSGNREWVSQWNKLVVFRVPITDLEPKGCVHQKITIITHTLCAIEDGGAIVAAYLCIILGGPQAQFAVAIWKKKTKTLMSKNIQKTNACNNHNLQSTVGFRVYSVLIYFNQYTHYNRGVRPAHEWTG